MNSRANRPRFVPWRQTARMGVTVSRSPSYSVRSPGWWEDRKRGHHHQSMSNIINQPAPPPQCRTMAWRQSARMSSAVTRSSSCSARSPGCGWWTRRWRYHQHCKVGLLISNAINQRGPGPPFRSMTPACQSEVHCCKILLLQCQVT